MTHYIYGSGMHGCLYDYGPNVADTREQAIESLVWLFCETGDETSPPNLAELMRETLAQCDCFTFPDYHATGAQFCEVSECDCDDPSEHDPDYEPPTDEHIAADDE